MGNGLVALLEERAITIGKGLGQIDFLLLYAIMGRNGPGCLQLFIVLLAVVDRQSQDLFFFLFVQGYGQAGRRIDAAAQ